MPDGKRTAINVLPQTGQACLCGDLASRSDGSLARSPRDQIVFTFDFLGAQFRGQGRCGAGRFVVDLHADLGPLPFSAESAPKRQAMRDLVAASAAAGVQGLWIDHQQMLRVDGQIDVPEPATATAMLTALTEFLLDLKPWLVQLAEALADSLPSASRPQSGATIASTALN